MEDNLKFKALVHYICNKCSGSDRLGATKLNKVLWFVDSLMFKQRGISLTGGRYKKLQHGPVPTDILLILAELQRDFDIAIKENDYFGMKKREFISLRDPVVDMFSVDELKFVDAVIGFVCNGHTARSISELTHDAIWKAASLGEEIPLYAVLAAEEAPLTKDDLDWANRILEGSSA